jgi:hypothetical protein
MVGRPVHDASAARTAMAEFQTAIVRAGSTSTGLPPGGTASSGALSRRTPGARLAPDLRESPTGAPTRRFTNASQRDPEAERATYDGFASGVADANRNAGFGPTHTEEG